MMVASWQTSYPLLVLAMQVCGNLLQIDGDDNDFHSTAPPLLINSAEVDAQPPRSSTIQENSPPTTADLLMAPLPNSGRSSQNKHRQQSSSQQSYQQPNLPGNSNSYNYHSGPYLNPSVMSVNGYREDGKEFPPFVLRMKPAPISSVSYQVQTQSRIRRKTVQPSSKKVMTSAAASATSSSSAAGTKRKTKTDNLRDGGGGGQVSEKYRITQKSMHQLMKYIFANYDKELMPNRPVYVKLDVLLLKVKSTVEKEGIFESVIALFIEWSDYRMTWDPADYDNVTVLAFDSEKVWLPDIAMTNSADHLYGISRDTRFVVRVTHDGLFKFVPTGTAKTWCELNLLTFPFDIQTCSLEFESWSLDSSTMAFRDGASIIVDDNFLSTQWTLCRKNATVYNVVYEFSGETFSRVKFDFTVRRKSTFYIINLVFPCATLSAIQLLVFAIPSMDCSSDRIGFGTTNLLTLVVFQTIVTEEMPKTSDAVTALSKYIIALIILSAVGIFESVVVERMRRISFQPPPPWTLRIARYFPLIWRAKSIPDYPSLLIAAGTNLVTDDDAVSLNHYNTSRNSKRNSSNTDDPLLTRQLKLSVQFSSNNPAPLAEIEENSNSDNSHVIAEQMPFIEHGATDLSTSSSLTNFMGQQHSPARQACSSSAEQPSDAQNCNSKPSAASHLFPLSVKSWRVNSVHHKGRDKRTPSHQQQQQPQRKKSQFTAIKDHRARREFIEQQYAELWGEIASRLDVLTFIVCTISVAVVPLLLFLPLLYFGEDCIPPAPIDPSKLPNSHH